MARYGKDHKQATRRRIIEAAGRRLKRDGIDGSGVAALMADAGLTNGAFYAHFDSKEDLVASAVADQLREQREAFSGQSLEEIVRGYLSIQHRDDTGRRLSIGRAPRRDRALIRRREARLHRWSAGDHR